MSIIYENIAEYASKRGISIQSLEKRAGLSNGTVGKWRNVAPTVSNLSKVANVLGVKPATLMKERGRSE